MDLSPENILDSGSQELEFPVFRHLGRKKAYEEVSEEIRAQILSGRLQVGQRLPTERELAVQFGMSRVAVREAIRALELNGLLAVKKGARGGIFVARNYERPISDSIANLLAVGDATLEDLFEVRKLIEPYAAARVAEIGTEEDFKLLDALVTDADQAHREGISIRELNIEMHRHIIRMSRNPVLGAVGETVLVLLADRLKPVADHTPSHVALSMHHKLLAAFRRRDAQAAQAIMAEDIEAVGGSFARLGQPPLPSKTG